MNTHQPHYSSSSSGGRGVTGQQQYPINVASVPASAVAAPVDTGQSPYNPDEEAEFLAPYVFHPDRFAREIFDVKFDPWQERAANKLLSDHFVTVRSGNGVGKTFFEAMIIYWFLTTRHMAQIPCTANSAQQLKNILWSNLSRMRFQSEYLQRRTRVTEDMVQVVGYEKAWFAVARTSQNSKGEVIEALQGFHGDYILFVVDEGSGVHDKSLDALESAATGEDSYGLMCSNATRRQGLFFRSWHRDRDLWGRVHVKPEDTTRVSDAFKARMRRKYGGENTNGYRIRVLGEFPKQSDMGLLSESAYDHEEVQIRGERAELENLSGDVTFSCDPAGDAAESDSATIGIRIGNAIYDIIDNRSMDLKTIGDQILGRALEIAQARRAQGHWNQRTIPCYIDVIGIGLGLVQYLERLRKECVEVLKLIRQHGQISSSMLAKLSEGQRDILMYVFDGDFIINPLRVNVGKAASKPLDPEKEQEYDPLMDELPPEMTGASGKEIYQNLRSQLFCYIADEISFQRVQICRDFEMLREDLTSLQKQYTTSNKVKIQSKKEFRSQNDGRSTDFGDAAVLLFVEDIGKDIEMFDHNPEAAIGILEQNLDGSVYAPLAHKPDRMARMNENDDVDRAGQSVGAFAAQGALTGTRHISNSVKISKGRNDASTVDQKIANGVSFGRKKFTNPLVNAEGSRTFNYNF